MLDDRTTMLIRALLYPVQFEAKPERGIDRVVQSVVMSNALQASSSDYLSAIGTALLSEETLSEIIPQDHDEATTRNYLLQLSSTLRQMAAPVFAGR
jgi:hypothetical protein